jgi:3'(2'), 5'-bisphosphate nucleotidase
MNPIQIETIIAIAQQAGNAILEIYQSENFSVETKADNSPLTKADKAANEVIVTALKNLYPEIPMISEENKTVPYEERKSWNRFWLVDPLDGTKEFIKRNGEFTVNIALIKNGKPIAGVVHVPVSGVTYYGAKESGAYKIKNGKTKKLNNVFIPYAEKQNIKVVASRSHLSDETKEFVSILEKQGKKIEFVSMGSSLKFCLVAEGMADVYPRFGPTMEWDTAAAQAVAEAAGRKVLIHNSDLPLRYNKENLLNPWFIVY